MGLFNSKKPENITVKGRFIVVDGTQGSGKTEQIELLENTMKVSGYECVVIEFPQLNSVSSELLTKYKDGQYGDLNPEAISILYAIDRFDVSSKIKTLINDGKIVIANRYVTSNAAYQGAKIEDKTERIKFYRWLDMLEYGIFNIPKPDLNIILYAPTNSETSFKEEAVFYEIAELFPNTRLIECAEEENLILTPNKIHAKVWELVRRIGLKGIEPKY